MKSANYLIRTNFKPFTPKLVTVTHNSESPVSVLQIFPNRCRNVFLLTCLTLFILSSNATVILLSCSVSLEWMQLKNGNEFSHSLVDLACGHYYQVSNGDFLFLSWSLWSSLSHLQLYFFSPSLFPAHMALQGHLKYFHRINRFNSYLIVVSFKFLQTHTHWCFLHIDSRKVRKCIRSAVSIQDERSDLVALREQGIVADGLLSMLCPHSPLNRMPSIAHASHFMQLSC